MPVGIGAAIAGAGGLGLTGTGFAIAATAINVGLYAGLTYTSAALAERQARTGKPAPRDAVLRGGDVPQQVVYGRAAVGGALLYQNSRDVGNDDFELWAAIAHTAHEVDEVEGIYYEDSFIDLSTDVNGSGDLTDTSNPWYAKSSDNNYSCRLFAYDGTQTASNSEFQSAFADIDANFQARGYCYTLHRFLLWQAKNGPSSADVFRSGEPNVIRALVKGKAVYDPNLDTSPGANPDNPSYIAWASNPVLCAVDYMRSYMDILAARFDWDWIDAEAQHCAVNITDPSGTVNRYDCNGAISLADTHDTNLSKILATCLGSITMHNGLIRVSCGRYRTPTVTLDESDVLGPIKVIPVLSRDERYNQVRGTYTAKDAVYATTEFQPVSDSNFVTRDNGETLTKEIAVDMCIDEYHAQRLAFFTLQQSDQQTTIEVPLSWAGLRLTPGSYCQFTYGKFSYSNKVFRCERLEISESDGYPIVATLREDTSSAWTDPTSPGDYTQILPDGAVVKPAPVIPTVSSLVANPSNYPGILLTWTNPEGQGVNWDYINIYSSATSAWGAASLILSNVTEEAFLDTANLTPGEDRYYWLRMVRNGTEGDRTPNSDTSTVTATVPPFALPNLINAGYSDFETVTIGSDFNTTSVTEGTATISSSQKYLGTQSLRLTGPNATKMTGTDTLQFGPGTTRSLAISNTLTEVQAVFYIRANADALDLDMTVRLSGITDSGSSATETLDDIAGLSANTWTQISWAMDWSLVDSQLFVFQVDWTNKDAASAPSGTPEVFIDGLMLIDTSDYSITADVP